MEVETEILLYPVLELAQYKFLLLQAEGTCNKQEIQFKLMEAIAKDSMLPFYLHLCEVLKWNVDQVFVDKLAAENHTQFKEIEEKIADAQVNLGESEIFESLVKKAQFYCKIGDKENSITAFQTAFEKAVGSGHKLDIVFTIIRVGLFWRDWAVMVQYLEKARSLVELGGDWDRKNRLKVYEALNFMSIREFKKSALLFLDTLSTFNSTELFNYNDFIFYTVVVSLVSLDRVTLREKVIDAPEILTVILEIPDLSDLLNSLYNSNYEQYFKALGLIITRLQSDRYLAPHVNFMCRELRILAYSQLLESYKSVQLESMAQRFGISVEFLDRELSRFIAAGRLHCKIDKVGGVAETNRPDAKNALYQSTIQQGDLLLNRIQKLSRVINL